MSGGGCGEGDDYMGDLSQFLPPEESFAATNSSLKKIPDCQTPNSGRLKRTPGNWISQEHRGKQREQKQIEEDEGTVANLETAIPQSNIGFKLLKRMGYTPGTSLGREGGEGGLVEPIGVEIKRSRAGIGREDFQKERKRVAEAMIEIKRARDEELVVGFEVRQKSQWRSRRIVVNYNKAKGALLQLGNFDFVEAKKDDELGEEEEKGEEEEEEVITEEELVDVLMKLREEYQYCLFCGFQYESMEALLSECPGLNEDDH